MTVLDLACGSGEMLCTWSRDHGITGCVGATWIGDGVPGTLALLERSVRPGGLLLVGEPSGRQEPRLSSVWEKADS